MKNDTRCRGITIALCCVFVLAGCATTANKAFETDASSVKLRSMQTRAFDTTDTKKMLQKRWPFQDRLSAISSNPPVKRSQMPL